MVTTAQLTLGAGPVLLQRPCSHSRPFTCRPAQSALQRRQYSSARRQNLVCRAEQTEQTETPAAEIAKTDATADSRPQGDWVPVITPEEFPKGVRKEVRVDGVDVLIFWYRNEIFAIEARSPAEGAYSEGFISSKLNQDYQIECPGTGSLFDFRTGEIKEWYPNNPVLRVLTPASTVRPLEVYPVRLEQDAILIDVRNSAVFGREVDQTRGGSDTSIDRNNVYGLEPKVYEQSSDARKEEAGSLIVDAGSVATTIVGVTGAIGLLAAGTATAKYWQTDIGLYAFWALYVVGGGAFVASKLRK